MLGYIIVLSHVPTQILYNSITHLKEKSTFNWHNLRLILAIYYKDLHDEDRVAVPES